MRVNSRSLGDLIQRRRRERDNAGERLIDLRIDIVDELTGAVWLTAGGVWDRRFKSFEGIAKNRITIRAHEGQQRAVEWFRDWCVSHTRRRETPPAFDPALVDTYLETIDCTPTEVYSALFAGGRRAGKTWIGTALAVVYAITYPDSIVYLAGPDEGDFEELIRYVNGILPDEWVETETARGWSLANGSRIELRSAYDPDSLKEGRADLILLNEGQRMKRRAFDVARGNIVDKSGLVIVCANPPLKRGDQQWVSDFAAEATRGERAALYVEFNSLKNPHIDRRALLAMSKELDKRSAEIEIFGRFLVPEDAVAYNWSRLENELPPPQIGDVTAEFLSRSFEGEGFKQVIGIDVQRFPYMAAVVYRFYGSPHPDKVIAWVVDEIALAGGDEIALAHAMIDKGYDPEETLLIVDASGSYQHSRRRSMDSPPPEWKGRGSFHLFKGEGFVHCRPPDKRQKRNPQIVDRVRAFTSMICNSLGVRRLFADPKKAPVTCKAIREWKHVHGAPSRTQDVAHMGDGASYPIIRLFPRRLRSDRTGAVDPVVASVDMPKAKSADGVRGSSRGRRRGTRLRGM